MCENVSTLITQQYTVWFMTQAGSVLWAYQTSKLSFCSFDSVLNFGETSFLNHSELCFLAHCIVKVKSMLNEYECSLKPHYDNTLLTPFLQFFTLCFTHWEPQQLTSSQYMHCLISMLTRERCDLRLMTGQDTD